MAKKNKFFIRIIHTTVLQFGSDTFTVQKEELLYHN